MPTTEFSESVAQFPVAGPFRGTEWDRRIESIDRSTTFALHRKRLSGLSSFLKRSMDVAISAAGLVVLALPMLLLALLIKLESRGPVFCRSERLGLKGRRIKCTKFRTMVSESGVASTMGEGARITRLDGFLRRHSIDEIPQFFDVLRGDMSIVGPRPPIASEAGDCKLQHLRRLQITPGMTGLWQVQEIQDPSFDSYVSLDSAYIDNWSPWLDVKMIAKAIAAAVAGNA